MDLKERALQSRQEAEISFAEGELYVSHSQYTKALDLYRQALLRETVLSTREAISRSIWECEQRLQELLQLQEELECEFDDDATADPAPQQPGVEAQQAEVAAANARRLLQVAIEADEAKTLSTVELIKAYRAAAEEYLAAVERVPVKPQREALLFQADSIIERVKDLQRQQAIDSQLASLPPPPTLQPPPPAPPVAKTAAAAAAAAATAAAAAAAAAASAAAAAGTARRGSAGGLKAGVGGAQAPQLETGNGDSVYRLTPAEIEVLKKSSTVNGKVFMPWLEGEEQTERFDYPRPWTDPDGPLELSPKQIKKLRALCRPGTALAMMREAGAVTGECECAMVKCITPYTITQDTITDCSFVASLCIASAFERQQGRQKGVKLITNIIYPQDKRGVPKFNPSGKYLVKLWVNGVLRKVVVDDNLPVGNNGRLLCSATSAPGELWVSIIEKAYMKVNGGYMFPGSNSGIDLFALTGWLPEQIFFEEHRKGRRASITSTSSCSSNGSTMEGGLHSVALDCYQPAERVWQRLVSAHEYGDCLVTVSTESVGETLTEEEAERLGLVPGHAYAVLDVKEVQGVRLLQVKNPWARKRWRGPYSVDDTARWTAAMKRAVGYDLAAAQLEDNGVFWIDWPSICRFFKNVFINWNPALFKYRSVLHGEWPVTQGPPMDTYNLGLNPQYTLTVPYGNASASASAKPPIVWVLLSRHVMELETDEASGDYLTLHVFDNSDGARVWYPSTPMYKGTYTNNPHTLVRFDLPERSSPSQTQRQYTLVLSQYKKTRDVRYTLNVYCSALFELQPTPEPPPHRQRVQGSWGPGNAGGRLGSARYHTNPQYAITLTTAAVLHVQLEAPKEYAINLTVVRSSGERVDSVPVEKEVLTSEAYRPGFCFAASPTPLPAGTYTVIVSTYEGGQQGGFILTAAASTVLQKPALVPAEGEGMWSRVVTGAWSEACGTAVGCCNYKNYNGNPQFSLSLTAPTTSLLLRLSAPATALRPALNVAVFEAASPDTLPPKARPTVDRSVCTSNEGVYTDGVCGCVARATAVPAGEYIVVVSTFMPQDCPFELAVYTQPAPAHFAQII